MLIKVGPNIYVNTDHIVELVLADGSFDLYIETTRGEAGLRFNTSAERDACLAKIEAAMNEHPQPTVVSTLTSTDDAAPTEAFVKDGVLIPPPPPEGYTLVAPLSGVPLLDVDLMVFWAAEGKWRFWEGFRDYTVPNSLTNCRRFAVKS